MNQITSLYRLPLRRLLGCLLLLWLGQPSLWAQDRARNFVLSRTYQVPIQQPATPVSVGEASLSLDYLDGLGRSQQQIQVQAGTNGKDLITSTEYDALGRPSKTYLPAPTPSRTGAFQASPATLATDYYNNSQVNRFADFSPRPFGETQYEASPLSRPTAVISAGTDASVQTLYGTNGDADVARYEAGALITEISQPASPNGYYAAKQLTTQTVIDEMGKQTTDYKDKDGRLVLRRVGTAQKLDTYYVYDDLGQLRAVLQPEYQSSNNLTLHAFLYRYNGRGLLVEQQIPGGGTSTMVYDNRDRLISRTDGRGQKFYYQYDALNRLTHTGICTGSCDETNVASQTNKTLLSQTFYDDYDSQLPAPLGQSLAVALPFLRDASTYSWNTDTDFVSTDPKLKRKGQSTGSCARLLSADGNYSNEWHCVANYYDDRYRLIQSVRRLPLMGNQALERVSYRYDFGGKVLSQKTQQSTNTQSYGLEYAHRYDESGRPLSTQLKTSSSDGSLNKEVVLSVPQYNEIGTQVGKALGATDGMGSGAVERLRYRHLVRGFLQQQQASRRPFGLTYTYQTNGNVNSLAYQYPTAGSGTYGFEYDEWNRMTKGRVSGGAGEELNYSNNGNIKTLKRYAAGGGMIDDLTYIYEGGSSNRLQLVTDGTSNGAGFDNGSSGTGNDYSYDGSGNLLTDNNRGTTLSYNCLNLPRQINFSQNPIERNLNYVYDASGQKLSVSVGGVTTYYQGPFEYDGSMNLVRLSTGEGQLVKQNSVWQWQYYLSDQQGNVRVVVQEGGSTLNENQYYPFGLSYAPSVGTGVQQGNRYQFLGKETQPQTGYVDLQARQYDPQLGRFVTVDPVTEGQEALSPYQYGWNSPINKSDPTGRFPDGCCGTPSMLPLQLVQAVSRYVGETHSRAQQIIFLQHKLSGNEPSLGYKALAYGSSLLKGGAGNYTDLNDAAVLTRGKNLDGSNATTGDRVAAAAGAMLPLVSGKALTKIASNIGEGLSYPLKATDKDLRGSGISFKDALNSAFESTGVPKDKFTVTKWGKNELGKSVPVEYRAPGGAEISVDYPHTNGGLSPDAPHIGWQTSGKGKNQTLGHIILDNVPAGRGSDKLNRSQY